ncbi:hypothetical protein PF008_g27679 [Phytophthora fragariae]|uniref:Uncharacterized protein n=1 Tax=Phytophthora fragariae TaxID=53985 RepID=A0A6G0QDI1_9STRA|nr:hypothetical protein PF008_g27679 [Phytophthora fragariae]
MLVKRRQFSFSRPLAGRCSASLLLNLRRVLASVVHRRLHRLKRYTTRLTSAGRTLATMCLLSSRCLRPGRLRRDTLWKG